jgi:hypothetical protein
MKIAVHEDLRIIVHFLRHPLLLCNNLNFSDLIFIFNIVKNGYCLSVKRMRKAGTICTIVQYMHCIYCSQVFFKDFYTVSTFNSLRFSASTMKKRYFDSK